MRATKVCGQPGCPHIEPCPDHPKIAWAGSTRRSRLPSDWPRRRRQILSRDPVCQVCANALSTEVDHVTNGDNHDPSNLQGICKPCHKAKTQAEARAGRGGG